MSAGDCADCGRPSRQVCFLAPGQRGFVNLLLGNRVVLASCAKCGALWCFSRQGMQAAPAGGVAWSHSAEDWQRAYDADDGALLGHWHITSLAALCRAGGAHTSPPAPWPERLAAEKLPAPPDLAQYVRGGK